MSALIAYIEEHEIKVLIADHVEHLPGSRKMRKWLDRFSTRLKSIACKIIFIRRTSGSDSGALLPNSAHVLIIPRLNQKDLERWLQQDAFHGCKGIEETAEHLHKATGGCATLIGDFSRYTTNLDH